MVQRHERRCFTLRFCTVASVKWSYVACSKLYFSRVQWKMIRDSCRLSFRSTPIREYLRVPYWLLFNVCPAIYAFPHFESRTPNVSVFYITEWSFWCSNEFNGGQCEMKLRRLQQASFLPCTVENDKRQLQAQSQSRSTSKSGISLLGAFLVVLQLLMDIMLTPRYRTFLSFP